MSAAAGRQVAGRYHAAAAALDAHVAACPACASGRGCQVGDDRAEAEYRSFDQYRAADPAGARRVHDAGAPTR